MRKEVRMNIKKTMALVGSMVILGFGLASADSGPQKATRNSFKNEVKLGFQAGPFFVDEDGDGICDFSRDHDNDGIPNNQDPDWDRPQDGSGYKERKGNNSSNQFGNKNGFQGQNAWKNQSLRQNRRNFGSGICDSTGPKGQSPRKGNGRG
jgi:hypothetical protein